MKKIFLTSNVGGYRRVIKDNQEVSEIIKCDNTNHFIDRLKLVAPKINTLVFIASNPDGVEKTELYANTVFNALNLDDFEIKNSIIIDHRFIGDIEQTILSADVVYLLGGHVPTQNNYLKEICLDKILAKYNGIVIGQSAGSMNLAKTVYAPPECIEDLSDDYEKSFSGVGLTNIRVMPHMGSAFDDNVDGQGKSTYDYCIEDSYNFPVYGIYDYGFIEINDNGESTAYGKTLLIKNGECIELCGDKESVKVADDYVVSVSNVRER